MYDVLSDRLMGVRLADRSTMRVGLAELMALFARDQVLNMTGMRAHQAHAFHAFCAQLAAIAMRRRSLTSMPVGTEVWHELLSSLGGEGTWDLVVSDSSLPAFMQPPCASPEGLSEYRLISATPDDIDVVWTSRNHAVKKDAMWDADPEHWVYALISIQSSGPFGGRGYHCVSRMSGGYGSRVGLSLAPDGRMGRHVARDAAVMVMRASEVFADCPMVDGGVELLWNVAWSGADSIDLSELGPYYIEVCRRLRLVEDGGRIAALRAGSEVRRIDAKERRGVVGDPWLPVDTRKGRSIFLMESGFTYRVLATCLLDDGWELPMLARPTASESSSGGMFLVARGLSAGQCRTDFYHERRVPLDLPSLFALGDAKARRSLGEMAAARIAEIASVRAPLVRALHVALTGRTARAGSVSSAVRRWVAMLEADVDAGFFGALQSEFALDGDDARRAARVRWIERELIGPARAFLEDAIASAGCASAERMRRLALARVMFEGGVRHEQSAVSYVFEERP